MSPKEFTGDECVHQNCMCFSKSKYFVSLEEEPVTKTVYCSQKVNDLLHPNGCQMQIFIWHLAMEPIRRPYFIQ
jgi:hypothetical protein